MLNKIVTGIFAFLLGVFVVLLVKSCHKPKNKPLNNVIQYVDKEIIKTDTLIKTKKVVRNQQVEKLVPYQHLIYVPSYILCEDTIKIDSLKTLTLKQSDVIKQDDSVFVLYRKKDSLQTIKNGVTRIYIDSILNAPNKYFKGFRHGFVAGNLTGFATAIITK